MEQKKKDTDNIKIKIILPIIFIVVLLYYVNNSELEMETEKHWNKRYYKHCMNKLERIINLNVLMQ